MKNLSQAAGAGLQRAIAAAKTRVWQRENVAALASSNAWEHEYVLAFGPVSAVLMAHFDVYTNPGGRAICSCAGEPTERAEHGHCGAAAAGGKGSGSG